MKRKKRKRKTLANGKIIITDFRGIDPKEFVTDGRAKENMQDEVFLVAIDGRLFFNSENALSDILSDVFSIIMAETQCSLEYFKKAMQRRFWWVRTLEDFQVMRGSNSDKMQALTMLLIPLELQRREVENAYFQKK